MNLTQQLNQLLPEQLRPGSSRATTTELERLTDGGWLIADIHKKLMGGISPNAGPGVIIHQLRELPDTPPPPTSKGTAPPKWAAHTPCPDNHKGMWQQPCQLCHCDPDQPPQHHVETDAWWGWPDLTKKPDDYGPGWLRNPPTQETNNTTPSTPLPF